MPDSFDVSGAGGRKFASSQPKLRCLIVQPSFSKMMGQDFGLYLDSLGEVFLKRCADPSVQPLALAT
jgi:hypothetical protein